MSTESSDVIWKDLISACWVTAQIYDCWVLHCRKLFCTKLRADLFFNCPSLHSYTLKIVVCHLVWFVVKPYSDKDLCVLLGNIRSQCLFYHRNCFGLTDLMSILSDKIIFGCLFIRPTLHSVIHYEQCRPAVSTEQEYLQAMTFSAKQECTQSFCEMGDLCSSDSISPCGKLMLSREDCRTWKLYWVWLRIFLMKILKI